MKHAEIEKALTKAIEPFVRELAADLTKIAARAVAEQLDVAREHAVAKLREQLEGTPIDVEEHDGRSVDGGAVDRQPPQVARPNRAASRRDMVAPAQSDRADNQDDSAPGAAEAPQAAEPVAKKTRAKMNCGKCGAIGKRADGCGRTHNVDGASTSTPPLLPPGRIGSRESSPQPARAEASGDADEEPAPVGGMMQPPVKTRPRPKRSRPRATSFGRASRGQGHTFRALEAKLGIKAGAPIEFDLEALRPKTRGECRYGLRPCPWVGCDHHFYLDVNPETGSIKLNFPDLEIEQLDETCSLDVADRGGITLEETGRFMNLTRERVRQVETRALANTNSAELIVELRSA